ncbi:hypothetical protein RIF29_19360 [Crotalaria pallida]|uniref:Uncharacterized protein n=1 Tax=Crotalaria pallida TaxID=3830 RepID=A0AAN9I6F7_CROPI
MAGEAKTMILLKSTNEDTFEVSPKIGKKMLIVKAFVQDKFFILRQLRIKLLRLVFRGLHLFVAKIKVFNGRGEVSGTDVIERNDDGGEERFVLDKGLDN